MLFLPRSYSTPTLISFGIVAIPAGIAILLALHQWLVPSPLWIVAAFAWTVLLGAVLIFRPLLLDQPYGLYNRAIGRLLVRPIRCWILRLTFFVLILANRPFSKRLQTSGASLETGWHPKSIGNLIAGSMENDGVAIDDTGDGRWLGALLGWIRQTGNWWVIALIPFMLALALIDEGEAQGSLSTDTYTLY